MHKVIEATKDTGLDSILDPSAGRPIWRVAREKLFQVLNQVGGGLGDYVIQAASIDVRLAEWIPPVGGALTEWVPQ
jgi:hypothetical protein